MKTNNIIIIVIGLIVGLAISVQAENKIVVNVNLPECPYYDSHLDTKLYDYLSMIDRAEITYPDSAQKVRLSDQKALLFDDVVKIGEECQGRYLIDIDIDRIDVEKRKITVIPLVIFRYRVYGVMTGRLKIIDVARKKVIETRDIDYEIKASDQWQVYDDDPDYPALLIPADRRIELLDRVDDKAAENLFEEIKKMTRGVYSRG